VNILVTGGAGYIGGTVTRLLLERGHSVVVYDNLYRGRRAMVPAGASFVEGDVADTKRLEEVFSSDSFTGVLQ
jgi:UDP-glucose 4-epimerase